MDCPNKHGELKQINFHHVDVDYCPECLGIWFNKDELRLAKDDKDKQLNWLDFDVWRDKGKFKFSSSQRQCPICRAMFVEVSYDDSKVKIDFCKNCQGIWLDRGEFKQIIAYLKRKSDYEILHKFSKNLILEMWEVFTGPENLRSEIGDFIMLTKLFNYKFVTQHPLINAWIEAQQK